MNLLDRINDAKRIKQEIESSLNLQNKIIQGLNISV